MQSELRMKDELYFRGGILQVRSTGGLADTRAYGEDKQIAEFFLTKQNPSLNEALGAVFMGEKEGKFVFP